MPSPQSLKIRREYPDYWTTREVAEIIGRSKETVERWRKNQVLEPNNYTMNGSVVVWLYDDKDLEQAKQLAKSMKRGRKA